MRERSEAISHKSINIFYKLVRRCAMAMAMCVECVHNELAVYQSNVQQFVTIKTNIHDILRDWEEDGVSYRLRERGRAVEEEHYADSCGCFIKGKIRN